MFHNTLYVRIFVGLLILSALWLVHDFLYALGWAAIVALLTYNVFRYLTSKNHHDSVASLTTVLATSIIILLPIGFLLIYGAFEVKDLLVKTDIHQVQKSVATLVQKIPYMGNKLAQSINHLNWNMFYDYAHKFSLSKTILPAAKSLNSSLVSAAINILIFFVFFYTFLIKGSYINRVLKHYIPDGNKKNNSLTTVEQTVRGTSLSMLTIGLITLIIMTTCYFCLGLYAPVLLGLITALFSFIPFALSIFYILLGVILLVLTSFPVWKITLLLVIGFSLHLFCDNILQPRLINKHTKLNFATSLLGVLGGLGTLGIIGIFVGPIVLNLLLQFVKGSLQKSKRS